MVLHLGEVRRAHAGLAGTAPPPGTPEARTSLSGGTACTAREPCQELERQGTDTGAPTIPVPVPYEGA